jgi:hypothetical protein
MAGLIDGLLILVAYILYPFVIAIFGFFYIFYGSVLYIFGPIVIALMPLGATNRLAKAYVENVFIWNAWPILYGGFGALLSAVQMGQVGQMLSQNNFLGGLGNLEGSFLIGAASIIYSLAIAVIPFIAKRIVSGEVGATAGTLLGAATTALTAGIAAAEGIGAGVAASSTSASSGAQGSTNGSSTSSASTSPGRGNNQPTAPQRTAPVAQVRQSTSPSSSPTSQGEHVADNIRGSFSEALNNKQVSESSEGGKSVQGGIDSQQSSDSQAASSRMTQPATSAKASSQSQRTNGGRGPSPALMRPHGLATWGAYQGARLATQGVVGGARAARAVASGVTNPVETAGKIGAKAGQIAGTATNAAEKTATTAAKVASAITHPRETVGAGVQAASSAATAVVANTASTIRQSVKAVSANFSEAYEKTHSGKSPNNNESD